MPAVSREGASARAHRVLREQIMRGELAPGAMLSENELARELSMSRTPVRSALSRLQDEGWVTIYPQRGALVRDLTAREVREAADVRHALEAAGVRRGTAAARAALAAQVGESLMRQEQALRAGDFPAFTRLALDFHRAFVALADNKVMLEVYDRLQDRQSLSIVRSAQTITGDPALVIEEHRLLVDDASRGDVAAFAEHLSDHQERSHGLEAGG